uniref:GAIN-B domain-containing protein n=1 Tax=Knipowitschia caucasica TaxID=637954 RepID=A0AAV2JMV2_KNICA
MVRTISTSAAEPDQSRANVPLFPLDTRAENLLHTWRGGWVQTAAFLSAGNSVASIHVPLAASPLSSSALQSVDNSSCRLQLIVFRNGKLFPCTGNSSNLADDGKRRSVSTPVAFTKLDGCSSLRSAVHSSVTIALRHFALGVDPTAAFWDFDLLDGHGGWRAEGCHITGTGGNTTTIHCSLHHNNFAVLMPAATQKRRERGDAGSGCETAARHQRDWDTWIWFRTLSETHWESFNFDAAAAAEMPRFCCSSPLLCSVSKRILTKSAMASRRPVSAP